MISSYYRPFFFSLAVLLTPLFSGCFAGGGFNKGGKSGDVAFLPAATMTRGAPYNILCYDEQKAEEEKEAAIERGDDPGSLAPPVKLVDMADYKGGCEREGESTSFFLFNSFPVTDPLNVEYAIGTAVQQLEGDTMVNIRIWHEVQYYAFLGRVSVVKVRGDVVRFLSPQEQTARRKARR